MVVTWWIVFFCVCSGSSYRLFLLWRHFIVLQPTADIYYEGQYVVTVTIKAQVIASRIALVTFTAGTQAAEFVDSFVYGKIFLLSYVFGLNIFYSS